MAKMTQTHRLYQILKNGEPVQVQKIADELKINYYSVAVYICELKAAFKADIKSVKNGRKVVAYQLLNADKIKVPVHRKSYLGEAPKAKATAIATIADELEAVNTGGISEREFADIRSSLGLDFGGRSDGGWE